ncbi:helix-turn-helix domain-containing protein [Streptomyces sp. BBFR109]|uniref:helix-turn-helix domain-containing protein n=1 Tax=Streptomyces sp. BBFR109 TaxID=3448172 RepID=UPI003F75B841
MTHDPERWAVLGHTIRSDRERQGLTREALAERLRARGGQVTARSIASLEKGIPPKKRPKPLTLEPVAAALGWKTGWTDRILAGEDPHAVLEGGDNGATAESPQAQLLELAPRVYEFSRMAVKLGAPTDLRDRFDQLVQELLDTVSAKGARPSYGLAASRPHAAGEGVPADDAARIQDAMRRS